MATFKNTSGQPKDIPMLKDSNGLDVYVDSGKTVEIPDELAGQFEENPDWASSKTQSPTVTVDPAAAAAATGPVPVVAPTPVPAPEPAADPASTTTTN